MNESKMLTLQDCESVVIKCLKSGDIQTVDFTVNRLENENFLVKINVNHNSQDKTLNFFAKSSPKAPKIHKILFDDFKKALPRFEPKITPKLYFCKSDFLLFEDLTWQGFQTQQGFFGLEEVRCVLKVLAKFHAGCFAFEETKSQELGREYRLDEEYKLVYSNINLQESEAQNIVSSITEDDAVKIIEDLEARQFSRKHRKTLCHSNLTRENIMFKCKNGVPVEFQLINFKSKHYAPPVYDVLQLIFFNTSQEFRQHHLEELIADYYNFLKKELENYCLKIENILTVDELQLASFRVLPLIKLEAVNQNNQKQLSLQEFQEIIKNPILSREDCYVIARNKIGSSDYNFLTFAVTPLDEANGYLGDYHTLKITIFHKNEEKNLNCFIKCLPNRKASKGMVEETGCFFKEAFIYQTLVPQMHQLGIYILDECLPSCYFQRSEDLIVFEDLALNHFKVLPATIPFDFNLLCLVLKKLARFHSSMILFEEKMSEKIGRKYRINDEYERYLQEIFLIKDATHGGAKLIQTGVKSVKDIANLFPEIKTAENQTNFSTMWPKLLEIFYTAAQPSNRFRNVLSHGDIWTNNIMIQLDGEKPIDCCFVDYQCIRYCPPVQDYLSVLYLTSDRTTRMKHEEKLQEVYYIELSQILFSFGYNIEEIHPHQDFVESIKYIKPQMVMQAIMWSTFTHLSSEEKASFLTNEEACNKFLFEDRRELMAAISEKSSVYRNRLKECIIDLYDICNYMCSE